MQSIFILLLLLLLYTKSCKIQRKVLQLFNLKSFFHFLPYSLLLLFSADLLEVEQYNENVVFQGIIDCAKAALEHDIPVVLGNDVGCPWIIQCPKKEKQSKKNSTAFSDLSELSFFFSYLPILSRWLFHFSHHNQIFRHFFLPVL